MALELGQVEVRARPLRDQRLGVVEEEEPEVEERGGHRAPPPVHGDVLLVEMPTARPHHQRRRARREGVAFPLGARERDRAADGVPQVDLPLEVVAPRRGVRVLEVRHVDPRARVEGVDDHLAVHRPRDLDAAVRQIGGDRRDAPARFAEASSLGQEVRQRTGVEPPLPLHASREQRLAARLEGGCQLSEEPARLGGQDAGKSDLARRVNLEPADRHDGQSSAPVTDGLPGKEAGRAGMPRDAAQRFPAAPLCPSIVVGGAAAGVHTRCAAGAAPAFTWLRLCRLSSPRNPRTASARTTLQPSCHARAAKPRSTSAFDPPEL